MLNKIRTYPEHVVVGVGLILIGWVSYLTPPPFTWPPVFRDIGNDHGFDVLFIAVGAALLWWVMSSRHDLEVDNLFLSVAVGCLTLLTMTQMAHAWHAGLLFSGAMPWVQNLVITVLVVRLAWREDDNGALD